MDRSVRYVLEEAVFELGIRDIDEVDRIGAAVADRQLIVDRVDAVDKEFDIVEARADVGNHAGEIAGHFFDGAHIVCVRHRAADPADLHLFGAGREIRDLEAAVLKRLNAGDVVELIEMEMAVAGQHSLLIDRVEIQRVGIEGLILE